MEDEKQIETDRQHAEVFDALGHPTRILILKVLSEGAVGFADLKKKTAIESSGHLQHHLTKLNGLIKTDEYGKYCLSDQGKDALLTVQTVENASPKSNTKEKTRNIHKHYFSKIGLKPIAFLLMALLITSSAIALYEYNQTASLHNENTFLKGSNPEAAAFYNQFGAVPIITNTNPSFAPPISMYQAISLGLETCGLNKTSLQGKSVFIELKQGEFSSNNTIIGTWWISSPPTNYSDVYSNGITYRYLWVIGVGNGPILAFDYFGYILVDASTGQVVPTPAFAPPASS